MNFFLKDEKPNVRIMKQLLGKTRDVIAYMFHKRGFFTRKLVVGTMTLMMMLFLDIKCHVWDGMGMILLVLLTLYVVANYAVRYVERRREDEETKTDDRPVAEDASVGPDAVEEVGEEPGGISPDEPTLT